MWRGGAGTTGAAAAAGSDLTGRPRHQRGTIASTPAVINAVVDALSPYGITDIAMPASPERVWQAIQASKGGSA